MKQILFTSLMICFCFVGFGQQVSFSFKAFRAYIPKDVTETESEYNNFAFLDQTSLPDSIFLSSRIRSITRTEVTMTPELGFGGTIDLEWDIAPNWAISTGLNFDFYNFKVERNSEFPQIEIISLDTVPAPTSITTTSFFTCDRWLTSTEIPLQEDVYRLANLTIPVKAYYSIWDGEIRFFGGGYFSTPIFANQRNTITFLDREVINNETVCSYRHETNDEKRNNDFRNINLGIITGLEYSIFDRLAVDLTYQKSFSPLFADEGSRASYYSALPSSKVSFIAANLKFTLNPTRRIELPDNQ